MKKIKKANYKALVKVLLLILLVVSFQNIFAQVHKDTIPSRTIIDYYYPPIPDSMKVYLNVDTMPQFPGNINTYFRDSLHYPDSAKKNNIQGTVFVSFIIERNGAISNVNILRSSSYNSIDNEAKRIISTMPNWTPGQQNGKPVRVSMMVPVHFKLPPSTDSTGNK